MMYRIVDTPISVELPPELAEIWKPFLSADREPEIRLDLQPCGEDCYGIESLTLYGMARCLRMEDAILLSNREWTHGRIYGGVPAEVAPLLEMQLYSYLLTRGALMLHSSLVDWQKTGIMFLGPSGIGKTTQAELWNHYQGAKILNGDMVFVRKNPDGFYGYGSPWHGSSPYYEAEKVKLRALVILEQGPENELNRLEGFQALQGMMNQVFLATWYREAMDRCLETLDQLLEQVLVYHLRCRPDQAATELVKAIILQETEPNP